MIVAPGTEVRPPALWIVVAAAVLAVSVVLGGPALAVSRSAGAVVVDGADRTKVLGRGGSSTPFSIRLPDGAACPGDSEQGQYRVQGFLVPAAADPGEVVYKGLRPVVDGAWALYRTDTTTFMNAPTNKAEEPGGEGRIINLPVLSLAVFEPGMLVIGRYHLGVACSLFSETKRYWSVEVEMVADAADKPAGIGWQVVRVEDEAGSTGFPRAMLAGVVATAVAVPVVLFQRHRRVARRRSAG